MQTDEKNPLIYQRNKLSPRNETNVKKTNVYSLWVDFLSCPDYILEHTPIT